MKRLTGFVLSLALLAQACGPAPQAEPSTTAAPSAPPSSVPTSAPLEPTPSAAAAVAFDVTWESVGLPERGAELTTGIWDDGRWIIGGLEWCPGWCARIWTSDDGRVWTRAQMPRDTDLRVTAFTRDAEGYVAALLTCDSNGILRRSTAVFWRSPDASRWEPAGSVELGTIDEHCLGIDHVAATEAGLIGTTELREASPSSVLQSSDGEDWTPVSSEAFGLGIGTALHTTDTIQVDAFNAIIAASCRDCPVAAWLSGDSGAWTELGRIDAEDPVYNLSAAIGSRVVIARFTIDQADPSAPCITPSDDIADHSTVPCRTSVWALDDDGSFHEAGETELGYRPHLAFMGDAYLLVGTGQGPGESRAFASVDGLGWTRVSPDPDVCGAVELVGSPSHALLMTDSYDFYEESDPDCAGGMWLIDVTGA